MSRIPGIDVNSAEPAFKAIFEAQAKQWGAPLYPHLVYARVPAIFRAVRAMWAGLGASGLIDGALAAIVNRRVAGLNGCVF